MFLVGTEGGTDAKIANSKLGQGLVRGSFNQWFPNFAFAASQFHPCSMLFTDAVRIPVHN